MQSANCLWVFLTIIRFSLVILLPITTKHLTWYPNWCNSYSSFLEANLGIDLFKVGRENDGGKQRMTTYNGVHNILSKEE